MYGVANINIGYSPVGTNCHCKLKSRSFSRLPWDKVVILHMAPPVKLDLHLLFRNHILMTTQEQASSTIDSFSFKVMADCVDYRGLHRWTCEVAFESEM